MGAADNIRTTEVVKVEVARGAITTATVEPGEPTPDIYEQLLAAYGRVEEMVGSAYGRMESDLAVERARINELTAMRSGQQVTEYLLTNKDKDSDGNNYGFSGWVRVNGNYARLSFSFLGETLNPGTVIEFHNFVPPELAPFATRGCPVEVHTDVSYISAYVFYTDEGAATFFVSVAGDSPVDLALVQFEVIYPLREPTNTELADLRVGFDGVTYPTAGEALRGQFGVIESALDSIIAMQNELIGGGAE
jgi:hypothetical protein